MLQESYQEDNLRCLIDHLIKAMYESSDGAITEDVIKAVFMDTCASGLFNI